MNASLQIPSLWVRNDCVVPPTMPKMLNTIAPKMAYRAPSWGVPPNNKAVINNRLVVRGNSPGGGPVRHLGGDRVQHLRHRGRNYTVVPHPQAWYLETGVHRLLHRGRQPARGGPHQREYPDLPRRSAHRYLHLRPFLWTRLPRHDDGDLVLPDPVPGRGIRVGADHGPRGKYPGLLRVSPRSGSRRSRQHASLPDHRTCNWTDRPAANTLGAYRTGRRSDARA